MNADERKALNKAIAVKLGWRVEEYVNVYPPLDLRSWVCYRPDGSRANEYHAAPEAAAWAQAPDFCGSLDATAAELAGKPIRLSLDFEEASAELEDMADEVDSEYGINRIYFGEPTSAADIAEAAALALDEWLTWRADGEETEA